MRDRLSIAYMALALLTGAFLAVIPPRAAGSKTSEVAGDALDLTSAQQRSAWKDLSTAAQRQGVPSAFYASVGATVPSTIKLDPVPGKAASDVPALGPYDFALIPGKVIIVNPYNRMIVEVIAG